MEKTHVRRHWNGFQNSIHPIAQADRVCVRLQVDVCGLKSQGLRQNLVDERRNRGLKRGIRFLPLYIEYNLLADFRTAAFFTELLNGFGSKTKVLLDHRVDGTRSGEDAFE